MTKDKKKLRKISKELISDISKKAASSVDGVHSVKSVKVLIDEDGGADVGVGITVNYGTKIPDVAWHVQNAVDKSVKSATSIKNNRVDINISGVKLERSHVKSKDDYIISNSEKEEK